MADVEAGLRCLLPVLETLEALGPSPSLAEAYCTLALLRFHRGQPLQAVAAATRAAEVARAVGDRGLLAEAAYQRACSLGLAGRDAEGLPLMEEAAQLAEAVGRLDTLWKASQLTANIYENRGEFERARPLASRSLSAAEQLADPVGVRRATIRLAALAFFEGNWSLAHDYLARLEPLPEQMSELDASLLLELGRLCLAEGAWEEAARYLEACCATARHVRVLIQQRVAQSYLAERDLLEGRPETARARLVPLLDREDGVQERDVTSYVLPVLAWAYLELGDVERAAQTIEAGIQRARALQYRLTLVGALRVRALVAMRQSDMPVAAQALEEGLTLARALPYPHGEGRLLEVCARLHFEQGEPKAARDRLAAALAIFQRLGARKDAERAEQLLSTLG